MLNFHLIIFVAAGIYSGCGSKNSDQLGERLAPATSEPIAFANLQDQTNLFELKVRNSNDDGVLVYAEMLVGLYQSSVRYYGEFSKLDKMSVLADQLLNDFPAHSKSHEIAANVYSSLHLFGKATAQIKIARELGGDEKALDKMEHVQWQARGENFEVIHEARKNTVQKNPTLENLGLLAGILADMGRYQEADQYLQQAVDTYSDLSPYAFAWIYFQRGVLWGEKATEPNLELAGESYKKAIQYLPRYSQARVHYSEVLLSQGRKDLALETLGLAQDSEDPEGKGTMAELLLKVNPSEAQKLISAANEHYHELLGKHELAFADHASEFYMGPGQDADYAEALALRNLDNRRNKRSYSLAIDALTHNKSAETLCEVLDQMKVELKTKPYLEDLYLEHSQKCL